MVSMFTLTVTNIKGQPTLHLTTLHSVLLIQKESFKKGFIMGYIYFTLATFLLAAYMAVGVRGQTYQNMLQSFCNTAVFKDCCQVNILDSTVCHCYIAIIEPCLIYNS